MRFKVSPFNHPEYSMLRSRHDALATLWGVGHTVLARALALAIGLPLALVMVGLINPELRSRFWPLLGMSAIMVLVWSIAGVGLKRYAVRRARRSDVRQL